MERIAFIGETGFVYWSPIILALAAVAAIAFYAALYIRKEGNPVALFLSILLSVGGGIPLSRLIHWYHRTDAYASLAAAMTDYSGGGFALYGVFFACLAAACLLRLLRISRNLPGMLDCMAMGGGVGIAVGRMASLFNSSDRGMHLPETVGLPFAWPMVNAVSGASENRLATFMIQNMVTGLIVALLGAYMFWAAAKKKKIPQGDIFLIFIMAYGASQIICDSTRYDSLYLRSNGFVSIVQILGLVALVLPIIYFSVRTVKQSGFKGWYVAMWIGQLALIGLTGFMEYFVQRRGHEAPLVYSTMTVCLLGVLAMTLLLRRIGTAKAEPAPAAEEG